MMMKICIFSLAFIACTLANEDIYRDLLVGNVEFGDFHHLQKRSVLRATTNLQTKNAARSFVSNLGNVNSLGSSVRNTDLESSCLNTGSSGGNVVAKQTLPTTTSRAGLSGLLSRISNRRFPGGGFNPQIARTRRAVANRAAISSIFGARPTTLNRNGQVQLNNRDIVFVIDTSGSIPDDQFDIAKEAVSTMVKYLCPAALGTGVTNTGNKQISVVLFGSTQSIEIKFSDSSKGLGYLQDQILGMTHRREGATATTDALRYVRENVLGRDGSRLSDRSVSTDVIVITDGRCNRNCATLGDEADKIRLLGHRGVNLFALGIGNARDCELEIITGLGSDLAITLRDFNSLDVFADFVKELAMESDSRCA